MAQSNVQAGEETEGIVEVAETAEDAKPSTAEIGHIEETSETKGTYEAKQSVGASDLEADRGSVTSTDSEVSSSEVVRAALEVAVAAAVDAVIAARGSTESLSETNIPAAKAAKPMAEGDTVKATGDVAAGDTMATTKGSGKEEKGKKEEAAGSDQAVNKLGLEEKSEGTGQKESANPKREGGED